MFLRVFVSILIIYQAVCSSYHTSWANHNHHQIPQDVMVDVVNNLALKLLAIHSENNDNNIAISPYGALSVLISLKEGVRGNAEKEIDRAAGIPADLSVMRIGLRDIHRHLKSYFVPDEGFLSGLTFSHDNVTLNREYEDILKFYGFDINSFNNGLYPDFTTTQSPTITEPTKVTTDLASTETYTSTTEGFTEEVSAKEETSSDITTDKIQTTTETTTESQTIKSSSTIMSTTLEQEIGDVSTESPTEAQVTNESVTTLQSTTTTALPTITTEKMLDIPETTTTDNTDAQSTLRSTTTESSTSMSTENVPVQTTTEINEDSGTKTETILSTSTTENTESTTVEIMELTTNKIENASNGALKQLEKNDNRSTRSVVDYIVARYYDDHIVTQRPPPYTSENDLYFYINGKYKESNVNFMTYDTVLPFHYIPHLKTLALRFPLDSSKYYLLLLLPENLNQLNKLLCDLRLNTSLKYIIHNLRYTHVKAIIPSFMLKGYVVLTPTFQKMGIYSVFEPRQADFSPMTSDRGIYVTNIEQAITVNIRNYMESNTMNKNNEYLHRSQPVLFRADHPFIYFVIDSELDVTLMAGKIVNPLNSRIK